MPESSSDQELAQCLLAILAQPAAVLAAAGLARASPPVPHAAGCLRTESGTTHYLTFVDPAEVAPGHDYTTWVVALNLTDPHPRVSYFRSRVREDGTGDDTLPPGEPARWASPAPDPDRPAAAVAHAAIYGFTGGLSEVAERLAPLVGPLQPQESPIFGRWYSSVELPRRARSRSSEDESRGAELLLEPNSPDDPSYAAKHPDPSAILLRAGGTRVELDDLEEKMRAAGLAFKILERGPHRPPGPSGQIRPGWLKRS